MDIGIRHTPEFRQARENDEICVRSLLTVISNLEAEKRAALNLNGEDARRFLEVMGAVSSTIYLTGVCDF